MLRLRDRFGAERLFATGITSTEEDIATIHGDAVLKRIKGLCEIIEDLSKKRKEYTIDDVAELYRDRKVEDFETVNITGFKTNRKLVTIGKPFKEMIGSNRLSGGNEDTEFDFCNPTNGNPPNGDPTNGDPTNGNPTVCELTVRNLTRYVTKLIGDDTELNRNSTLANYRSTRNALFEFIDTLPPDRTSIDSGFIRDFNQWLLCSQKLAGSTVSFYLRVLRAILNKAQEEGIVQVHKDWFKGLIKQYPKEDSADKDKALGKGQIKTIADINLDSDPLMALSRDLFMFSFYCRGMELVDILNLKKENIHGDIILYNKRLTGLRKAIKLEPQARRIIDRYSRETFGDDGAIFSAIRNFTESTKYSTYQHIIAPKIAELGKRVGLKMKLKFGTARTTWDTMAKESNMSSMMLE